MLQFLQPILTYLNDLIIEESNSNLTSLLSLNDMPSFLHTIIRIPDGVLLDRYLLKYQMVVYLYEYRIPIGMAVIIQSTIYDRQ